MTERFVAAMVRTAGVTVIVNVTGGGSREVVVAGLGCLNRDYACSREFQLGAAWGDDAGAVENGEGNGQP